MQDEPLATASASREALNELIALRRMMSQFNGCTSVPQTNQPYHVHWQVRSEHVYRLLQAELTQDCKYKKIQTGVSRSGSAYDPCTLLPRTSCTERCCVFEKSILGLRTIRVTIELIEPDESVLSQKSYKSVLADLRKIIPLAIHGAGDIFETDSVVVFDRAERCVVESGFYLRSIGGIKARDTILTYVRANAHGHEDVVRLWFTPTSPLISIREAVYYPDPTTGEYVRYGTHGAVVTTGDDFDKRKIVRRVRKDNALVNEDTCVWRVVLQ